MRRRTFLKGTLAGAATASIGQPLFSRPANKKLTVGIIGCGRMGQYYAEVYKELPDTEIVAIAEWNDERRAVVGERFGVKKLYKHARAMLADVVPDVCAVITPTKFMKDAVIACAEAGVKGVSTDKPIAARLSDADAMVEACEKNNVVFAGGNLQRAKYTVQHAAKRLHSGEFGEVTGAAVHRFSGEISGGGCQHICVLRLLTGAEVSEVTCWGGPKEALAREDDAGLNIDGVFRMSSGLPVQVFSAANPYRGIDVWTKDALVRWDWASPEIYHGYDANGARKKIDPGYPPFEFAHLIERNEHLRVGDDYLITSIRTFVNAVRKGTPLWVSGHDLRQALEAAIASKLSVQLGNKTVKLPLKDRSLALYPRQYRWAGGDVSGRPQSADDAAGKAKAN